MEKLRSWLKPKWKAFSESQFGSFIIFISVVIFFAIVIILVLLIVIPLALFQKLLEVLCIIRVPAFGKVTFVVVKKSDKWVQNNHNSLSHYCEEGYAAGEKTYAWIIHIGCYDANDSSVLKVEFDPEITNIEDIKKTLEQDGLETNIQESKVTFSHRRFLFWTFNTRS